MDPEQEHQLSALLGQVFDVNVLVVLIDGLFGLGVSCCAVVPNDSLDDVKVFEHLQTHFALVRLLRQFELFAEKILADFLDLF